jgi:plastocyanin
VTAATTPTSAHATHGTSPSTPATQPSVAADFSTTTGAAATPTTATASLTEPEVHVVLGEWALIASATQAPPGPTTFRFHNAGTVPHALRIRGDGDNNDDLEWRSATIGPGQEATLTADLPPGRYEIDCPKEDSHGEHDALGMETSFQVSAAAPPLTAPTTPAPPATPPSANAPATSGPSTTAAPAAPAVPDPPPEQPAAPVTVAIQAFAFQPESTRVRVGDEVTWANNDPTTHNATGSGWATATLPAGGSSAVRFDAPGTYEYRCTIHPSMRGTIIVE